MLGLGGLASQILAVLSGFTSQTCISLVTVFQPKVEWFEVGEDVKGLYIFKCSEIFKKRVGLQVLGFMKLRVQHSARGLGF